jgi:hypothetical protein
MNSFKDILKESKIIEFSKIINSTDTKLSEKESIKIAKDFFNNNSKKEREERHKFLLKESTGLQEQLYKNLNRKYYHISNKKLKIIKEFGNEKKPAAAFFSLNPQLNIEFSKNKYLSHEVLYIHKCYLTSTVNLFNALQDTSREKIKNNQLFQQFWEEICNKEPSHRLWWRFWEAESILKDIRKMNYDGIALDFWDKRFNIKIEKTMGIALFQGNKITIGEYAECNTNSNIDKLQWKSIS